jgi:polysaccharide biosynthesis protein PslH
MRILQLCHKFPYPLKDGAAIAITYLARAFAELGHEVNLLAMNTSKHWFDPAQLPSHFDHYSAMHTVFVDNRIRPWPAFINLFTAKSYHIERFDNPDFAQKLSALLTDEHYDVVQLESLYLTPYVPVIRRLAPKALVVLRAHNVEHEIWERVAANANPLKKWYLDTITPRLKAYEIAHLNDYDLVLGITARDVEHFRRFGLRKPAVVTPIGLDCRDYRPDERSFQRPLSLSFIGSLDWMPNQEGLRWFLDEVWLPVLAPAFPELSFHIAGRTAPRWLQQLQMERVTFHGEVPDAADFINQHSIMVVPLLSGGGMRAKILEGMAVGKVVLSTRIGMEGIEARHQRECLLADTAAEMAEAIKWCYAQGPYLVDTGRKAWAFCSAHFDNLEVARLLVEKYREMQTRANVPVL